MCIRDSMCPLTKGAYHGPAPIPQEGKWTQAKEIKDISGLTHGVGWCAPVSYTHLDVYKRQAFGGGTFGERFTGYGRRRRVTAVFLS